MRIIFNHFNYCPTSYHGYECRPNYCFRYLLKTLDDKTSETKVQIADMTVKTQQILQDEYGKEVSLLFLMENVNDAIPSGANVKYAEIITTYMLLIK